MEAYTDFADVYDLLMDNVPYDAWCESLCKILRQYGIFQGIILDLGCGTGSVTKRLALQGYDMIGLDGSARMLSAAIRKSEGIHPSVLYLHQDMREFELYGTVKAVVSVCDSINYLLKEEDLIKTFSLVNNYLDPQGIFIFDFNTVYNYKEVIGDCTIAENREECSFIWENTYHERDCINEYDLTFFVKEKDRYRKFEETHYQRGYTAEQMRACLEKAGLNVKTVLDAGTYDKVSRTSERILMVAQECQK